MNKMTWLDLYNYLYSQANSVDNFGKFDWNSPVMIHDASTGEELICDTWVISNHVGNDRVVLATNIESIFAENNGGNS
jgi:hypothetical protein